METYRLKNIAIAILLLLNGCLLLLLGYQHLQELRTQRETAGQLRALYESSQLHLGERVDLNQPALRPLALSRSKETEQAIAASLLGGDAASDSQGGGIVDYAGEGGTIQFRSGGSFDGSGLHTPVEDPEEFSRQFCSRFGYGELEIAPRLTGSSAAAVQQWDGVRIYGCGVTLYFEGGFLSSVAGSHVSPEDAAEESLPVLSCVTALTRFLDYRAESGIVCSEVTDVRCVYELRGASSLRLVPVWRIETDTYTYFVDGLSGEVSRG